MIRLATYDGYLSTRNGYTMNAADIVGYMFNADQFCPKCIISALPTGPGQPFDGWALADGVTMSTEDNLNEIAAAFQIDRNGEYDTHDFPAIICCAHLNDSPEDRCGSCHELLLDG